MSPERDIWQQTLSGFFHLDKLLLIRLYNFRNSWRLAGSFLWPGAVGLCSEILGQKNSYGVLCGKLKGVKAKQACRYLSHYVVNYTGQIK